MNNEEFPNDYNLSFKTDESSIIHHGDYDYWYDADSMIISKIITNDVLSNKGQRDKEYNALPGFENKPKEIKLVKVDSDGKAIVNPNYTEDSEENAKYTAEISVYKVEETEEETIETLVKSGITSAKDGTLNLGHLDPDSRYYITESKAPDGYKKLADDARIYFTVDKDYNIVRDEFGEYEVSYTLNYKNGDKIKSTQPIIVKVGSESTIEEGFKKSTQTVKYFTQSNVKSGDCNNYDTTNATNYNIDCSNRHITKIVVTVSNAEGAGIQFKNNGDHQIPGGQFDNLNNGKNTFDNLSEDFKFGENGYMKITCWNADIDKIEYYCDGLECEAVDPKAELDSITVECEGKYLDGTKFKLDNGKNETCTETHIGTVKDGKCTISVNHALTKFPTLEIDGPVRDSRPNIASTATGSLVIKLPNKEERPKENYIEINKINLAGTEVVGAELTLRPKDATATINGTDKELFWTSKQADTFVIKSIKDGTYILSETKAPNGYEITADIEFKVADGQIVEDSIVAVDADKNPIKNYELSETAEGASLLEMIDERVLKIRKTNSDDTKALKGAKFELTRLSKDGTTNDAFKDEIVKFDERYVSLSEDKKVITWDSKDTSKVEIRNLANGTYTLKEISAPDGYKVKTVKFTIANDVITTEVDGDTKDVVNGIIVTSTQDGVIEKETSKENGDNTLYTVVVKDDVAVLNISKQEIGGGSELKDAKLTLTRVIPGEDGKKKNVAIKYTELSDGMIYDEEKYVISWTSGGSAKKITGIGDGDYVLHEEAAPDGYDVATDIEFTIENGVVKRTSGNTVTMFDRKTVKISKVNAVNNTELEGATLVLTGKTKDADEKEIDVVFNESNIKGTSATLVTLDKDGNVITEDDGTSAIQWVSDGKNLEIKGLPDGTYTLHEAAAPDGFEIATDITFVIKDNKLESAVSGGTTALKDGVIVMVDDIKKTDITISKQDIAAGDNNELPGATLTLKGEDNNGNEVTFDIKNVTTGKDAILISTKDTSELQWISGNTPTEIKNLPNGKYTLKETAAPDGYTIATEIEFTINNGKVTDKNGEEITDNKVVIEDSVSTIHISKKEVGGSEELAGATLTLTLDVDTAKEGATLKGVTVKQGDNNLTEEKGLKVSEESISFISGNSDTVIEKLPDGTYTLTETQVPQVEVDGKNQATHVQAESITFTVKNGVITSIKLSDKDKDNYKTENGGYENTIVSGSTATGVVMRDATTTTVSTSTEETTSTTTAVVKFVKEDANGTTLAGAKFSLSGKDENEKDIVFGDEYKDYFATTTTTASSSDDVKATATKLEWISGDTPVEIKNLPDGTYKLEEISAPSGFTIAKPVTFTIKDGAVTIDGKPIKDNIIVVKDSVSTIRISKKEVSKSEELAGAELTLTLLEAYKTGSTLNDITATQNNTKAKGFAVAEGGLSVSFVSVEKYDTVIEKLPDGKYQLAEIQAPQNEGKSTHEKAESITFTIKNGVITSIELSEKDKANYESNDNAIVSSTATGVVMRDATTTTVSSSDTTKATSSDTTKATSSDTTKATSSDTTKATSSDTTTKVVGPTSSTTTTTTTTKVVGPTSTTTTTTTTKVVGPT
ncbi:MAG: hypothetical protein K2N27_00990, partial [Ruminococcus sp.]|nr:hypothetical protein [Ruminococcus sp.]